MENEKPNLRWAYVLEETLSDGEVTIHYCSLNCSKLTAHSQTIKTNNTKINMRFMFFDINGKTEFYTILVDKNGNWVDVGNYHETQTGASAFIQKCALGCIAPKMKVGTIKVLS